MLRPERVSVFRAEIAGQIVAADLHHTRVKHTNHYRLLSEQTPVKYNVVPNLTIILCPMMSRSCLSEAMAGLHMMDAEQR